MPFPLFRTLATLVVLLPLPVSTSAGEYRLGPADRLDIRLGAWRTATSELRDWSALNGEYVVGADGSLSLPFAGTIDAEGMTTSELGAEIGRRIQRTLGVAAATEAAVQVSQYRPFFLSGSVENPGAYPYVPGLTVLKAVSIAGGPLRGPAGYNGADRDYINARGDLNVIAAEKNRLMASRARLEAEITGAPDIAFPEALAAHPGSRALMADQRALLRANRNRLEQQLAANADLQKLLETEIAALGTKEEAQRRQLELTREELAGVSQLKDQGLALNQRIRAIRQSVIDIETSLLDIQSASLRARQELNRARQEATTLKEDRAAELARQKQDVEAELEKSDLRARMFADLMGNALAGGLRHAADSEAVELEYAIIRTREGVSTEIVAEENTEVWPGDVVKVTAWPADPS